MSDRFSPDDAAVIPTNADGTSTVTTPGTSSAPTTHLSRTARVRRWIHIAVAAIFGIVYAYYLWDAIRSLIELPAAYELAGLSRDDAPWSLLVLGIILPIVTFVGALIVGRGRNPLEFALILLTGLGALAVLNLGVIALGM
jgi:hypothetical protein